MLLPSIPPYTSRTYSMQDGYDPVNNPSGNMLEGLPWIGGDTVTVGTLRSNSGNVYICSQAGVTAGSGGPSGTGSGITDNGAKWNYVRPQGLSVLATGSSGSNTAATGITFTGTPPTGISINRSQGSASGTVTQAIESPYWSSGQKGQRWSIAHSLGSGDSGEIWQAVLLNVAYGSLGIQASDLGVTNFAFEVEAEFTNVANLYNAWLWLTDTNNNSFNCYVGSVPAAEGNQSIASSGEMRTYPNGGKRLYRGQLVFPQNLSNLLLAMRWGFDASGAANSATCLTKVNYIRFAPASAI